MKPSRLCPRCPTVIGCCGRVPVIGRYRSSSVRRSSSCGRLDFQPLEEHQDRRHSSSSATAWPSVPAESSLNSPSLVPFRERIAWQAAWARSQPLKEDASDLSVMTAPEKPLCDAILPQTGGPLQIRSTICRAHLSEA